jgi:hypothetical protein
MTSGTLIAPTERPPPPAKPDSRPTYACPECGYVLHVSGRGRHRVTSSSPMSAQPTR